MTEVYTGQRRKRNRGLAAAAVGMFAAVIWILLCGKLEAGYIQTEDPQAKEAFVSFEDGEVIGFIGDSITHVRYGSIGYVDVLRQYYLTRFPELSLEFRNLGTAGAKACDVLKIYDLDPGFRGLDKAVIMLGTNEAILRYSTEEYLKDLEELIQRLREDGLLTEDIVVVTPPFCDESVSSGSLYAFEGILQDYLTALEEKTAEWGVCFLDLHTPMAQLTEEKREQDSKFGLTTDGIHPDMAGQYLLAYYMLKAQGVTGNDQEVTAKAVNADWMQTIQLSDGVLTEGAKMEVRLPFAVTAELEEFLAYCEPALELYRDMLTVTGCEETKGYRLYVDGVSWDVFAGEELAAGLNLAVNEKHPLQNEAAELEQLNRDRHREAVRYRDLWIEVIMNRASYTREQAAAKYDSWRAKDDALSAQMEEVLGGIEARRDEMTGEGQVLILEEGYTLEAYDTDLKELEERIRIEEEERIRREAEEKARKEAKEQARRAAEEKERKEREAAQLELERKEQQKAQRRRIFGACLIGGVGMGFAVMVRKKRFGFGQK